MTTLTVQATDTATAMDEIVEKLGVDALILSTTKRNGKVIMQATNGSPESSEIPMSSQLSPTGHGAHSDKMMSPKSFGTMFTLGTQPSLGPDGMPAEHIHLSSMAKATSRAKTSGAFASQGIADTQPPFADATHSVTNALQAMTSRIKSLEDKIASMMITDPDGLNPDLQMSTPVQLTRAGYDSQTISRLRAAYAGQPYEAGVTAFLDMLAGELSSLDSEAIMKKRIIYVIGASGSGRTTLAAKVAATLKGTHQGKEIALASLNNATTELDSKLKNFARILNLPTSTISNEMPVHQFDKMTDFDILVIDVCLPSDEAVEHILNATAHRGESEVGCILSIPGGTSSKMIELILARFQGLSPTIALTKLDECETGAAEFSTLANYQSRVGILSGTRAVVDALAFASNTILAQYLKENFQADGT